MMNKERALNQRSGGFSTSTKRSTSPPARSSVTSSSGSPTASPFPSLSPPGFLAQMPPQPSSSPPASLRLPPAPSPWALAGIFIIIYNYLFFPIKFWMMVIVISLVRKTKNKIVTWTGFCFVVVILPKFIWKSFLSSRTGVVFSWNFLGNRTKVSQETCEGSEIVVNFVCVLSRYLAAKSEADHYMREKRARRNCYRPRHRFVYILYSIIIRFLVQKWFGKY